MTFRRRRHDERPENGLVATYPDYRGTNAYQALLADALAACGVRVVFPDAGSRWLPLTAGTRRAGARIVHVHWLDPYTRSDRALVAIAKAARCALDLAVLRATGRRVVWTVHNVVRHESPHPQLEALLLGAIARIPQRLLVHGDAAREEVATAYRLGRRARGRITVVPHGNYDGRYAVAAGRAATRAALGIAPDETCLLAFGAIRRYKVLPALVRRFRAAAPEGFRLVVAGQAKPPGLVGELERAAAGDPRITLVEGFVPDDRVGDLLTAADAVLLSYERTLTSGTAVLAQTFGRAVVAPDVATLRDGLTDDGTVWIAAPTPQAFARALDELVRRGPERLGEAGRRAVASRSWDAVASVVAQVYGRPAGPAGDAGTTGPPAGEAAAAGG